MSTAMISKKNIGLYYTVQRGDSYDSIAASINACTGVPSQRIKASNSSLSKTNLDAPLPVGNVINIPYTNNPDMVLKYTTREGDTMDSIARSITICAGVTEQQIREENDSVSLTAGIVLKIPAKA